jgi:phosphoenolpyruvate synthase/pyruvate phosphate dikinase
MYPDPSPELSVLWEKFRALQTLVRHERDFYKLQGYKRELEIVDSEVQRIEEALEKRPNPKVLRFAPKKPVRSA